ncbi:hypothetical protein LRQ11_31465, partial [Pseudomonas sp. MAFF 311095]|uniref:hypothetical protein n=1 Tax=Pseudomonas petroselini TaxID=2899822 RepID=UPI001E61CB0F
SPLGDATITRSAGFLRVIQLLNDPFVCLAFGQFFLPFLLSLLTDGHACRLPNIIMVIIFNP